MASSPAVFTHTHMHPCDCVCVCLTYRLLMLMCFIFTITPVWKGNARKDGVKLEQLVHPFQGRVNSPSRPEQQTASHQAMWHLQINTDEVSAAPSVLFDLSNILIWVQRRRVVIALASLQVYLLFQKKGNCDPAGRRDNNPFFLCTQLCSVNCVSTPVQSHLF